MRLKSDMPTETIYSDIGYGSRSRSDDDAQVFGTFFGSEAFTEDPFGEVWLGSKRVKAGRKGSYFRAQQIKKKKMARLTR